MAASAHGRWTGNHFQISPQSGCQSWKGSHRKSCCLLFFFFLFFKIIFYAVPSSVPTSEALHPHHIPASLPTATPMTHSALQPCPHNVFHRRRHQIIGDLSSKGDCTAAESLQWCSLIPVLIHHLQEITYYAPNWQKCFAYFCLCFGVFLVIFFSRWFFQVTWPCWSSIQMQLFSPWLVTWCIKLEMAVTNKEEKRASSETLKIWCFLCVNLKDKSKVRDDFWHDFR